MPTDHVVRAVPAMAAAIALASVPVSATPTANFTGPLVTPAVNTLPTGIFNIQPYLIHTRTHGVYDNARHRKDANPPSRQWQVVLPMTYGITERLAIQLTPAAVRTSERGRHTDGLRLADTGLRLQQRLTAPAADGTGWVTAVAVARNVPTGRHHRLDTQPLNATGTGAARSSITFGAQRLYWLDGGRALRWRGQLLWSPTPPAIRVRGTSVYGTLRGFRGHVHAGSAWQATLAAEYALDPRWVLVGEAIGSRQGIVRVHGDDRTSVRHAPSEAFSLAPAVEYHFNTSIGLIAGVQFTLAGRNQSADVTPQVALNMLF